MNTNYVTPTAGSGVPVHSPWHREHQIVNRSKRIIKYIHCLNSRSGAPESTVLTGWNILCICRERQHVFTGQRQSVLFNEAGRTHWIIFFFFTYTYELCQAWVWTWFAVEIQLCHPWFNLTKIKIAAFMQRSYLTQFNILKILHSPKSF